MSVMDFLKDMRADIDAQNQRVNRDLSPVNLKVDSISDSILSLRTENEQLRTENRAIRSQMEAMKLQLDNLEGHSRRNNLRINGIAGSINENWSDSEANVREFIKNDLNLPAMETVQIERAHRIKSKDPKKCTIFVKFNSYKDREYILDRSKCVLGKDSDVYVKPDYTERVARYRRLLGSRMLRERENGNYATIRHDKLIVDDQIFRYDDLLNDTVCIGKRRRRINPRSRLHGTVNNNTTEWQRLDEEDHVNSGVDSNTTAHGADWSAHEDEGVDKEIGQGCKNIDRCIELSISILSWNIQGLNKYSVDSLLKQFLFKYDMCVYVKLGQGMPENLIHFYQITFILTVRVN